MLEFSYLGKVTLIWYSDGIDPKNDSGIQKVSHHVVPTMYQNI